MPATFQTFQAELNRLVDSFSQNLAEHKNPSYVEAQLRDDFLNPFFAALGWDIANTARLIQKHREVEIESRTQIAGRQKRADYLFRVAGRERFVCEAKKPAEELNDKHCFQAKRYAWNKELPLALLTDFEDFKLFVVGGKPHITDGELGLYKKWNFTQLPASAREIWDLLARDSIAAGSIEKLIETLPKRPTGKGKYKQGWLIKPDRSRSLDVDFLNFLDEARRDLASDLLKENDRADLLDGIRLNEATQRILDRILFLRICEDRDIDTGTRLDSHLQTWRRATGKDDPTRRKQSSLELHDEPAGYGVAGVKAPKDSLWRAVVRHFRNLDRRPPSHVPFFNGNLFKPHFSEELIISDEWLARFIGELSDDESPYLFAYIPVEILGTIYERFLGKVVRPQGRGVTIEEKPEVRKAGGVYYTPRYIVEYIVAQTVEKLLAEKKPEATLKLRFLDPACGSGSFLIRVFEAVCEYWQQYLTDHPEDRKKKWCWTEKKPEAATDDVHLTMSLKREILLSNVYGVDLDPGAVEVTQLSLYLKMLENESRNTLLSTRSLFQDDEKIDPLLPPLGNNIICGNSLIASDFSMIADDLVRVRAFDWNVGFREISKSGGFDAVVGNPPYVLLSPELFDEQSITYLRLFEVAQYKADLFHLFIEQGLKQLRKGGEFGMIVPNTWLTLQFTDKLRRYILSNAFVSELVIFQHLVFEDADVFTVLLFLRKGLPKPDHMVLVRKVDSAISADDIRNASTFKTAQNDWNSNSAAIFETRLSGAEGEMVRRLTKRFPPLTSIARASLGCQAYNSSKHTKEQIEQRVFHSDRKIGKEYLPELAGNDVARYEINRERGQWIKYGPWLHDFRTMDWLEGPRILIREISGAKPYSIFAAYTESTYCHYKTILNVNPSSDTTVSVKYLTAVLNSRLISFLYPFVSNKLVAQAFPRLSVGDVKRLPIAAPDLKQPNQKRLHDRLVELAEKMIVLVPKLRTAKSDHERQTLQNAVTATDQQIDALVYELYGLTEDEIKIVEGNS